MDQGLRTYLVVTGAYWAFTLTDGAIHMLVVLHFHNLGYSPLAIAFLFLFYEVFGIITNGVGGWIASFPVVSCRRRSGRPGIPGRGRRR